MGWEKLRILGGIVFGSVVDFWSDVSAEGPREVG